MAALAWPHGGYAPFRGEKGTTWEGGVRIPCLVRWPGVIAPGTICNAMQSHEDVFVTLAAAAGMPDLKEQLLQGMKLGGEIPTRSISTATIISTCGAARPTSLAVANISTMTRQT
jgi:arylsulfatase A-like enzyme